MGHGGSASKAPASARLDALDADDVATMMGALATASRLRLLAALCEGPHSVGELADEIGMERSAVSHQLRLLRAVGLVVGKRSGRHVHYTLYDDHVAMLLEEALHHIKHLRLGAPGPGPAHYPPDP